MQQKNHDYVDVEDDKYNVDDDGYIFKITEYFFKCKKKKKKNHGDARISFGAMEFANQRRSFF